MFEDENVAHLEKLDNMWVVSEAASLLGVKTGRVHAMIEDSSLPARFATLDETAELLASGRIKGVPGTGIRLIPRYAVINATNRRKPGWQKGRSRHET